MITLSDADHAELERRARCHTLPHAEVIRAKIVLLAIGGLENTVIAARLDVHAGVVSRWQKRSRRRAWARWRTGSAMAGRPPIAAATAWLPAPEHTITASLATDIADCEP